MNADQTDAAWSIDARRRSLPWWLRLAALISITALLIGLTARLGATLDLPPPLPVLDTLGGGFELPSTLGRELSLDELRGRPVLLNFGFTACPDACPTALGRLRALMLDLAALNIDAQPLFVTLDPQRDDLSTLKRYLGYFHADLIGLRGSAAATAAVAEQYHVYWNRQPLDSAAGDYTLTHSTHIYLVDEQGRVRATFGPNVTVAAMVNAVRALERRPWLPEHST